MTTKKQVLMAVALVVVAGAVVALASLGRGGSANGGGEGQDHAAMSTGGMRLQSPSTRAAEKAP